MIPQNVPYEFRQFLVGKPVDVIVQAEHDYILDIFHILQYSIFFFWVYLCLVSWVSLCFLVIVFYFGSSNTTTQLEMLVIILIAPVLLIAIGYLEIKSIQFLLNIINMRKGPWFAVTNDGLFEYRNMILTHYQWKSFTGHIRFEKKGVMTSMIALQLKSDASGKQVPFTKYAWYKKARQIWYLVVFDKLFGRNEVNLTGIKEEKLLMDMIKSNMQSHNITVSVDKI